MLRRQSTGSASFSWRMRSCHPRWCPPTLWPPLLSALLAWLSLPHLQVTNCMHRSQLLAGMVEHIRPVPLFLAVPAGQGMRNNDSALTAALCLQAP